MLSGTFFLRYNSCCHYKLINYPKSAKVGGLIQSPLDQGRKIVECKRHNICIFCFLSAPNSPKTKRGANGKFLPKPLLFHLRHPNSKTNEPKFWQILSPKNSFCKTSSALFRHLPETLRAEHQIKMSFPFSRKISPPPNQESKEHFSLVLPSEARQWRNDLFYIGILLEKSSDFVQETQQKPFGFLLRGLDSNQNDDFQRVASYR